MAKIRKAEAHEKQQWKEAKELYPLYGYVKVHGTLGGTKGSWQCAIEYLGEGKDNPNYEVHAPKFMHFTGGTHTLLCTTLQDLQDQILQGLEPCVKECGEWTGEKQQREEQK